MKNYKKKGMLLVSITVVFLLTIVFFYLLVSIKLWTYNSVSILNIDDDVITVFTTLDLELFEDNKALLMNAKEQERNMFKIPKVIQ